MLQDEVKAAPDENSTSKRPSITLWAVVQLSISAVACLVLYVFLPGRIGLASVTETRCDETYGLARVYGRALRSMGTVPPQAWESEVEVRAGKEGCQTYLVAGDSVLSHAVRTPHLDAALTHLSRPCVPVQVCVLEFHTDCSRYRFTTLGPATAPRGAALVRRSPGYDHTSETADVCTPLECSAAVNRHAAAARAANLSAPLHMGGCDGVGDACTCVGLAGPSVWRARISPREGKARRPRRGRCAGGVCNE